MPVCRLARHAASPPPIPPYRPRRYPSDTTDAEWALLEPLPAPASAHGRGGRPEAHHRRDIVHAIRYVTHNGCVWRALPCAFPPWRTVYGFYWRWNASGATSTLHDQLRTPGPPRRRPPPHSERGDHRLPVGAGRRHRSQAKPRLRGCQKVNGRKRHLAVDTLGLLLAIVVTPPASKTATAPGRCCAGCASAAAASCWSGPMPPTRAGWSPGQGRPCACGGSLSVGAWTRLRGPAAPLGHRADLRLAQPVSPHRPRLRAAARPSPSDGPVGDDHHHDPAAGPSVPAPPAHPPQPWPQPHDTRSRQSPAHRVRTGRGATHGGRSG